jgi:hypothetical protein
MPSTLRWLALISETLRLALPAATLMTYQTTGPRTYTSKPAMEATNVFLKFPTGSCSLLNIFSARLKSFADYYLATSSLPKRQEASSYTTCLPGKGKLPRSSRLVQHLAPSINGVTDYRLQGFRMLVGDAAQRTKIGNGRKSQSCFRCYNGPNFGGDNAAPCADATLDTEELPKKACLGGIRSNILYPT